MSSDPKNDQITLSSFPGSKKVYIQGSRVDIQVPMREIKLSPTSGAYGNQDNAPIRVYDTSGAYTDDEIQTDIRLGIRPNRLNWILERVDAEAYEGRMIRPEDNGNQNGESLAEVFPGLQRIFLLGKTFIRLENGLFAIPLFLLELYLFIRL